MSHFKIDVYKRQYLDSEHEDNSFVLSVPLVENTLRSLPKLEEITVETDTLGEGCLLYTS